MDNPKNVPGSNPSRESVFQWLQVAMLGETRARRVLGLGPDLGCVTAMIKNAGYDMGTLDF